MSRRRLSPAFTLIELLIVLAVVVLLLSILLPSLSRARQRASIVVCSSNLRQIAVGWEMYKQDYRREYPADLNAHRKFRLYTERYLANPDVFRCPADTSIWDRFNTPATQNSYIMSPVLMGRRYRDDLPPNHPWNAPRLTWSELDQRVRHERIIRPTVPEARLVTGGDYDWLLVINQDPDEHTDQYNFHGSPNMNNLVYFDGHASFERVYYQFYITPRYTLNPYRDLIALARDLGYTGP